MICCCFLNTERGKAFEDAAFTISAASLKPDAQHEAEAGAAPWIDVQDRAKKTRGQESKAKPSK